MTARAHRTAYVLRNVKGQFVTGSGTWSKSTLVKHFRRARIYTDRAAATKSVLRLRKTLNDQSLYLVEIDCYLGELL